MLRVIWEDSGLENLRFIQRFKMKVAFFFNPFYNAFLKSYFLPPEIHWKISNLGNGEDSSLGKDLGTHRL